MQDRKYGLKVGAYCRKFLCLKTKLPEQIVSTTDFEPFSGADSDDMFNIHIETSAGGRVV